VDESDSGGEDSDDEFGEFDEAGLDALDSMEAQHEAALRARQAEAADAPRGVEPRSRPAAVARMAAAVGGRGESSDEEF
jgi:hypothetical protein